MVNLKFHPNKVAQNLRAIRKHFGWSQTDLAKKLGVKSAMTISHYENGQRKIPIHLLPKIAEIYGFECEIVFKANKAGN